MTYTVHALALANSQKPFLSDSTAHPRPLHFEFLTRKIKEIANRMMDDSDGNAFSVQDLEVFNRILESVLECEKNPRAKPDRVVRNHTDDLTKKELAVLRLLADGYSNTEMANALSVSESTIRTHLRSINIKLYAKSRMQAVAIARRLDIIH